MSNGLSAAVPVTVPVNSRVTGAASAGCGDATANDKIANSALTLTNRMLSPFTNLQKIAGREEQALCQIQKQWFWE